MSYTNAPACKLLATHCCVCARPLLDAVSVEMGIGPDCRKKYMGKLEGAAREEANKIVHQLALVVSGMKPEHVDGLDTDAVQAAYALGGTKAVGAMLAANHTEGATLLERLRVLGFDKLADKFEKAWLPVRITELAGTQEIRLEAPYNDDAVAAQRHIPGRRWDKLTKANYFPVSQKAAVWAMLKRFYGGLAGIGPKGPFVVGGTLSPCSPSAKPEKVVAGVLMMNTKLSADEINAQEDAREARKAAMACNDVEGLMAEIEAEGDLACTYRDELAKAQARGML